MKSLLLVLTLGGLLAASVVVAVYVWVGMSDVELSTHGVIALILGVAASLALGVGLMFLVFYSHRKGHDRIDDSPGWRGPQEGDAKGAESDDDR